MPHVTHNGVRFHVQRVGAGRPVVFVHGLLLGNMSAWYFAFARTLAARHELFFYDLRGHGRSAAPYNGYDVDSMAADLTALTDSLGVISLVGFSYGALIALRFARDNPDRVHNLVLIEAPLPLRSAGLFDQVSTSDVYTSLPTQLADGLSASPRRAQKIVHRISFLLSETSLLQDLEEHDESDEGLRQIESPTLLLYGDRSPCLASAAYLQQRLPHCNTEFLSGGHYIHLDDKEALVSRVEDFLNG